MKASWAASVCTVLYSACRADGAVICSAACTSLTTVGLS